MNMRFFQFSLGRFILFVLVCGVFIGWTARKYHLARLEAEFLAKQESEAETQLRKSECYVEARNGHVVCVIVGGFPRRSMAISVSDLECLQWCRKLKRLEIDDLPLTDVQITCLSECRQLKYLGLSGTQITDAALQVIGQFAKLENLYLSGTVITDEGLRHLQGLTHLRRLNLAETRITDESIPCLEKLTSLEAVRISDTGVSPQGKLRLRNALPNCCVE